MLNKNNDLIRFIILDYAISMIKKLSLILIVLLIIALFTSCKSKEIIRTEVQYRDSLVFRLERDSIFMEIKDSVFVYMGKDTLFIERFKSVYKDRIRLTQDTLIVYKDRETIEKQIEKPNKWQNFINKSGLMFWLLLLTGVILFVFKQKF